MDILAGKSILNKLFLTTAVLALTAHFLIFFPWTVYGISQVFRNPESMGLILLPMPLFFSVFIVYSLIPLVPSIRSSGITIKAYLIISGILAIPFMLYILFFPPFILLPAMILFPLVKFKMPILDWVAFIVNLGIIALTILYTDSKISEGKVFLPIKELWGICFN